MAYSRQNVPFEQEQEELLHVFQSILPDQKSTMTYPVQCQYCLHETSNRRRPLHICRACRNMPSFCSEDCFGHFHDGDEYVVVPYLKGPHKCLIPHSLLHRELQNICRGCPPGFPTYSRISHTCSKSPCINYLIRRVKEKTALLQLRTPSNYELSPDSYEDFDEPIAHRTRSRLGR